MLNLPGYTSAELIHQSNNSLVYRASAKEDGQAVAFKTPAAAIPSPRQLSSLGREYQILKNFPSQGIPKVLGLLDSGPSIGLVLEYIDAPPLREALARGPFSLGDFFQTAGEIVRILTGIHRRAICHRDLSPGNILYNPGSGLVRVIDFGSALEFPRQARSVINPRFVEGSRSYMSPEQTGRMNRGLDYRTDFYSLGVIFYEMLAGRLPFTTTDHNELVHCHIAVVQKPLFLAAPGVPRSLSDLVDKLMSKDAADRYQSAGGLLADLVKCRERAEAGRGGEAFHLGKEDHAEGFLLPEKLYGRERETGEMLEIFRQATAGRGGMVFVAGHSGIGKTSLIRELYKPMAEAGGYIVSGKFDQYHRHLPYSALVEAFSALAKQVLSENEKTIASWRDRILAAVGANAGLLVEVIPELGHLLGPQPTVEELPVAEARTRFTTVFQQFVGILGQAGRPLVIFLDDLQWIDAPSLALLEMMAGGLAGSLVLLIGAYRSNEVPEGHPLAISLGELRNGEAGIREIMLKELPAQALLELLRDALPAPGEKLARLNDLLLEKTGGNPLFFKTMLNSLYADGHLVFDHRARCWDWDQAAIKAAPYADNVVDMLQSRIGAMPDDQVEALCLGAVIGNPFGLDMLAQLADVSRARAAKRLQPAVSAGLLQPLDQDFELLTVEQAADLPQVFFRFTHDRIQQAAHALLPAERTMGLHWRVGQILWEGLGQSESGQALFDAAAHLNLGAGMADPAQRLQLAELNLAAGKKAKDAAAFGDAKAYLAAAAGHLPADAWQAHHELALKAHLELAEACYLVGDFEEGEKLYGAIRQESASDDDLLTLINIQAKQYHHTGRYQDAIALEYEGLQLLGLNLPQGDEELFALFGAENQKIQDILGGADPETLYDRPEVDDHRLTRTHEILFDLFADAYLMGRGALLACAAAISTRLSMERGNCPMTSIGYINYASCLCAGGGYEAGHAFGQVAVRLSDKYPVAALKNYAYHLFALGVNHWLEPLQTSYSYWRESSKLALESGSPYAGWAFLQLAHVLLASGAPLERVAEQEKESSQYLASAGLNDIAFMLKLIVSQPKKHLLGQTRGFSTLDDEEFDTARIMEENKNALFFLSHVPYSLLRAKLLARDYQPLETMREWMPLFEQTMQGQFIHVDCYFYFTLHCSLGAGKLPEGARGPYLAAIDENLARFARWAKLCPANFRHKHLLIAAERARLAGDPMEAMDLYDQAAQAAFDSRFLQDAGLANELAGLFWEGRGKDHLALPCFERAAGAYARWGAAGKVAELKKAYPKLSENKANGEDSTSSSVTATGAGDFSAKLDLSAIIKASQAISQHMVLENLAGELLSLAVETAGASKGLLLLKAGDAFLVTHRLAEGAREVESLPGGLPYNQATDLSPAVVNYVVRTGNSVILDNPTADPQFSRCPYLKATPPKSLACVPILRQKEVKGALYLENSQVGGAFQRDRGKVLSIIASQAAISLENARIYQELDAMNKNLENKVRERTQELDQKNQELKVLSTTDQLTGLFNRRFMDESLRRELSRCRRTGRSLAVILLDIDHFKRVNDSHGHDAGDLVLKSLAATLAANTRESDVVGRWGGEEFLILVPEAKAKSALALAEKLKTAVASSPHGPLPRITASFGVAALSETDDENSLVKRADQGLYEAKRQGRDRVVAV